MTPGNLVMLKSGGPIMTVRTVEAGKINCEFFIDRQYTSLTFLPEQLFLVLPHEEDDTKIGF